MTEQIPATCIKELQRIDQTAYLESGGIRRTHGPRLPERDEQFMPVEIQPSMKRVKIMYPYNAIVKLENYHYLKCAYYLAEIDTAKLAAMYPGLEGVTA